MNDSNEDPIIRSEILLYMKSTVGGQFRCVTGADVGNPIHAKALITLKGIDNCTSRNRTLVVRCRVWNGMFIHKDKREVTLSKCLVRDLE